MSARRKIAPTGVCSSSSRSWLWLVSRILIVRLQPQRRLQVGRVPAGERHGQVGQAGELEQVGAVEEALHAVHVVQVDKVSAVDAEEGVVPEPLLQLAQRRADVVSALVGQDERAL